MASLMVSISGVRGVVGQSLTPSVVVTYVEAFAAQHAGTLVAVGRDSRVSGPWMAQLVCAVLRACGKRVIDLGVVATPTVQLAVLQLSCDGGGIVVTSSHNPVEWNGLKFVAPDSLFVSPAVFAAMASLSLRPSYLTGPPLACSEDLSWSARHVDAVLALAPVRGVRLDGLRVALDTVCGAGGPVMSLLLERLGATVAVHLHAATSGLFPRAPEPIPEHLGELGAAVVAHKCHVGVAVDPDVDRCVLLDETGRPVGEELTLTAAVDRVLSMGARSDVVKNMSSSRATDDVAARYGCRCIAVPVGEVHVAKAMQARGAVVGGEGNGGVLLSELHLGRDAPVACALVLSWLTVNHKGQSASEAFGSLPRYFMHKTKAPTVPHFARVVDLLAREYEASGATLNREDGLRVDTPEGWIHVRASNTEPVFRVIGEWAVSPEHSAAQCQALLERVARMSAELNK